MSKLFHSKLGKKEITVHTHALPRLTSKNVLADAYMATMQPIGPIGNTYVSIHIPCGRHMLFG